MAIAFGNYNAAQMGAVLVPAETDKIIRVLKFVATSWASVSFILVSNPGMFGVNLTAPLHIGSGQPLVVHLGRGHALAAERGKSLGVATAYDGDPANHSIVVWYEVVR